jgi:IS605 OrfB family transposase
LSYPLLNILFVEATLYRTARIRLRPTKGQARRCFGLLRSAGDVRAWILDCNRQLIRWRLRPVVNYQALCRELAGTYFGELDMVGARSILRRYATEWFEAAGRRRKGLRAGFPRRKKALIPIRYYHGTFKLTERQVRLPVARGRPSLRVRLGRPIPYSLSSVRSVTLLAEAGWLYLDVTAEVAVMRHGLDEDRVAGVDLGIIHPFALASQQASLLVSGRALRAEERLHLEDQKRRSKKMGRKAPKKGQRGSRRWRKLRRAMAGAEVRHRRRVRRAHHEAAKAVVEFAINNRISTLVVGDPAGLTTSDWGRAHNLRLRQWRRTHLASCLKDKAAQAGIAIRMVSERGTSSTCPECRSKTSKPKGRNFHCPSCGFSGHRDLVGARNIAARGGGVTSAGALVEHRRAGHPPARRDRRRHLFDAGRSCPAPGCLEAKGSRSRSSGRPLGEASVSSGRFRADRSAPDENQLTRSRPRANVG